MHLVKVSLPCALRDGVHGRGRSDLNALARNYRKLRDTAAPAECASS